MSPFANRRCAVDVLPAPVNIPVAQRWDQVATIVRINKNQLHLALAKQTVIILTDQRRFSPPVAVPTCIQAGRSAATVIQQASRQQVDNHIGHIKYFVQ
jgi:hypothetical protein